MKQFLTKTIKKVNTANNNTEDLLGKAESLLLKSRQAKLETQIELSSIKPSLLTSKTPVNALTSLDESSILFITNTNKEEDDSQDSLA